MFFSTVFNIINIIILFFIKSSLFYLLVKLFNRKTKFFSALRVILIYESIVFFVVLSYTKIPIILADLLDISRSGNFVFLLFDFLFFCLILFLVFGFLMTKFSLLNWKKSLVIFVVMNFIIPWVVFGLAIITQPIYDLPIFEREAQKITKTGLLEYKEKYPFLSITEEIYSSLVGISYYLREIIFLF